MKNVIVSLRVYRGQLNYDAKGNVTSENQIVKLKHDTQEYYNFLKKLRVNGYHKVEVEKAVKMAKYNSDETDEEITDLSQYSKEVDKAFNPVIENKTPEQLELEKQRKEIEELKALIKGSTIQKQDAPKSDPNELEEARVKYLEVFDKKPSHLMKLETILSKIETELNN